MTRTPKRISPQHGFALAEALVMILITGYCMIPILGTLSNGVANTQAFELRSAMLNIAESKMNELTAKVVYLGEQIADGSETIAFPNDTDALFHFLVTIEVRDAISLAAAQDPAHPLTGLQNKNLKSVSVKVALVESEPVIDPVTLTTLMDRPPLPGDKLYAAVPSQKKIYVIDPKTHLQSDIFDLSGAGHVPVHLAVHPNGDWLAIKTKNSILLMDIRFNSSTRGQVVTAFSGGGATSVCNSEDAADSSSDSNHTRSDRGIVFRPDGKYLYFTTSISPVIKALEVPTLPGLGSLPSGGWSAPTGWTELSISADSLDFELTEDGRLFTCEHTGNHKVINTHTQAAHSNYMPPWPNNTGKCSHHRSVISSYDGNDLAFLYCGGSPNNYLGLVSAQAPTALNDALMTNTGVAGSDHYMNDLLFSRDNWWLFTCSADSGQGKHLYAFARTPGEHWSGSNFSWNVNSANNRFLNTGNADGITTLKPSPYGKEIIADTVGNNVLFINVKNLADNSGTIRSDWTPSTAGRVSDISGRIAEQIWIPCDGGAGKYTVECLDLYGGDGGKIDDNKKISLSAAPKHAALTSGGDKLSLAITGSWSPYEGDCFDFTAAAMPLTVPTDTNTEKLEKSVWLLDRSLITLNSRPGCSSHWGSFSDELTTAGDCHNGFLLYKTDAKGNLVNTPVLGFGTKGSIGWRVRDVVAMHRRNGAYILFNNNATDDVLLLWVEKSKTIGYTGTDGTDEYKIMSVWQKLYDGFPEGRPTRIALSPDDTVLVLYDPNSSTRQTLRIYDLNNQRFPLQSGLAINRYNSNSGSFSAAPTDATLDLKKALTNFRTDSPLNPAYPFNFYHASNNLWVSSKTLRFFGRFYHPAFRALGLASQDGVRIAFNGSYPSSSYNSGTLWSDGSNNDRWSFNLAAAAGASHFQGEYYSTNDSLENAVIAYSTTTTTSCPSVNNGNPSTISGGGGTWNVIPKKSFRALRFRPSLLKAVELDGSAPWPNKPTADGDSLHLIFHRDTAFPYLLLANQTDSKLYAVDLFPISSKFSVTSGISGTIQDLRESPDGRRLIVATKDPDRVYLYDIAYGLPFSNSPSITISAPKTLDLPGDPLGIAVRPFSSFSSQPDTYREVFDPSLLSPDGSNYVPRYGKNSCTLGNEGIYIIAGANGHDTGYTKKSVRFNPVEKKIYSMVDIPAEQANQSVFSYDDRIFSVAGYNGATVSSIFAYEPAVTTGEWLSSTSSTKNYDLFRNNANTAIGGDHNAACLTPYGPVIFLGHAGTGIETAAYFPDARMNTSSPPLYGETLAMPSSEPHYDATAVCHYSRQDKKWYLYRVGGGTSGSSAGNNLIQRFDFDTNTWGAGVNLGFKRVSHAACAFGDEILVFGGHDGSAKLDAYAYNPDSGKVRSLKPLPNAGALSTAEAANSTAARPCGMGIVACGPYVYLIDGAVTATAGNDGSRVIRVYRP